MARKILVADLLCGAGGSSTGAGRALRDLGEIGPKLLDAPSWDGGREPDHGSKTLMAELDGRRAARRFARMPLALKIAGLIAAGQSAGEPVPVQQ